MSQDGFLHFGDTVMLVNSGGGEHEQRGSCVLSIIADSSNITSQSDTNSVPHLLGPLQVGGAHSMTPCVRSAFIITRYQTCTFKLTQSHTHSGWSVLSSVVCVQCWWDLRWRGAPIRSKLCPENDRRLCRRGKQANGMHKVLCNYWVPKSQHAVCWIPHSYSLPVITKHFWSVLRSLDYRSWA